MKTLKIFLLIQFVPISLFFQNILTVNNTPCFAADGISIFADLHAAMDNTRLPSLFCKTNNLAFYPLSKLEKTEEANNAQLDVKNGGKL